MHTEVTNQIQEQPPLQPALPIAWPKDAKDVRDFFHADFISAKFAAADQTPCNEDRYLISAHDFLSAVNWWANFPHAPRPPQAAPLPLLIRDIARDLGITALDACRALKDLGNFSVNMAVTAEMAAKLRELFPVPQAAPAAVAVPDELIRAAKQALACMNGLQQHLGRAVCQVEADALRAALAATPAAVQTHAEAAAALCINSALTRIRAGNHAEAIEPLEHALRALAAAPSAERIAATITNNFRDAGWSMPSIDEARVLEAVKSALSTASEAAAPVVLPETEAAVREVMELIGQFGLLVMQEDSAGAIKHTEVIKAKLRALLAGVSAPAAQAVETMEMPPVTPEQFSRDIAELTGEAQQFQQRVQPWMMACFGPEISADRSERNHRFLEEALELVQSCGCTASEAHQLVEYVFGRPVGDPMQEAGGVMVTLAALGLANDLDMHACGETELARIWTKVEAIRAKQSAKPKHSPLPMHLPEAQADARAAELLGFLQDQCIDLRCFTTSDGEDVGWRTVQHHMSEPRERVVSEVYGDQPRRAIREAMARIERDPYCTGPLHLEDDAAIAAAKGE